MKENIKDLNEKLKEIRKQERKTKILVKKHKLIKENQALRIRNIEPLPPIPVPAPRQVTHFASTTNPGFSRFNFNFTQNDQHNLAIQRFRGRSILNIPSDHSIPEVDSISNSSMPFSDV